MNTSQRRLLVAACVLGAVLLHLSTGRWETGQPINMEVCILAVDGDRSFGWNGPGNHAFAVGVGLPLGLLVAAAFVWLGGRTTAAPQRRS